MAGARWWSSCPATTRGATRIQILLDMARRAKASGADAVGIYRSHAVDQLGLWPVVEAIANM